VREKGEEEEEEPDEGGGASLPFSPLLDPFFTPPLSTPHPPHSQPRSPINNNTSFQYPSPASNRERGETGPPHRHTTPLLLLQAPAAHNMQAFAGQRVAARTGLAAAAPRRVLVIEAAHKKGQFCLEANRGRRRGESLSPSSPHLAAVARRDRRAILRARCAVLVL
jgi:hypothetical protein